MGWRGGISYSKAFNFWVMAGGIRVEREPFPVWFFECGGKPGRGRREGRASSWAGCKVSWSLRLTPHPRPSRVSEQNPWRPVLELALTEQDSHLSKAWQCTGTCNWVIFQVSSEDTFFPNVVGPLFVSQSIPGPLQLRNRWHNPANLTVAARGVLRN